MGGDDTGGNKGKGCMRWEAPNVRGRGGDAGVKDVLWEMMDTWGVDILGVADTRVWAQGEESEKRGAASTNLRNVVYKAKEWGGVGMEAAWGQGTLDLGGHVMGGGGGFGTLLAHEGMGRRRGKEVKDKREWGRMGGLILQGKGGLKCAFMEAYYPCRGSFGGEGGRMWDRQLQGMRKGVGMGVIGGGVGQTNPRTLLTKDLREVWAGMADKGIGVVVHMDANLPVERGACTCRL